jgi:tryptophan synthase beta chain
MAGPSAKTNSGRSILEEDPDSPGSLGIATSEAVEEAASRPHTNYALGAVLNHVLLYQTAIGLEAKKQLAKAGDYPDVVIACCGGGSNFGGTASRSLPTRPPDARSVCSRSSPSHVPRLPADTMLTIPVTLPVSHP